MQTCEVLGGTAEFRIVTEDSTHVEEAFRDLWTHVFDFEQQFSRFRHESELMKFNEHAGERVEVSSLFRELLCETKHFGEVTRGAFNPFILPGLERAGYTTSMTEGHSTLATYATRAIVPVSALEVGETWARIPRDTALDLGGIGKGFLADYLARTLAPCASSFCLSLGGDMSVSGEEPRGPWTIDVESSIHRDYAIGTYTHPNASSFGIATSGTHRVKQGRSQAHLIDPRTGMTVETPYRTCTVVARNAVSADVLASCVLIEGVALAQRLFEERLVDAILLQGDSETEPLMWGEGFHVAPLKRVHAGSHQETYA